MAKKHWGFDTNELNTKARPQDDFFEYANGGWLKKNPIPNNEPRWGAFNELIRNTDNQLKRLLVEIERKRGIKKGSEDQIIRDFYHSGVDIKKRNALGARPLEAYREKIRKIKDIDSLVSIFPEFEKCGITTPFSLDVYQDLKDATKYTVYIEQSGLGLPDKNYYLKTDADSLKVKKAYIKHINEIFKLLEYTKKEVEEKVKVVMKIEEALAKASMDKVDLRNPEKIYNKVPFGKLKTYTPLVDWSKYLKQLGAKPLKNYILAQPKFMREVNRLLKTVPISDWQTYLEWHLTNDSANYLSEDFVKENFVFYGKVISGSKEMKPLWRRILNVTNSHLGEALGKLYVKKHFPEKAKEEMELLVDDLFEAYEERIKGLEWMSSETKKKALKKLGKMTRKIGYPNKWKSYKGLVIKSDDYFGNVIRSHKFAHKREMNKIGKPIDHEEWFMYPQTVNAYYSQTTNEIVFPAAILQPPFFDLKADPALNYGSIGTVIGHEITHGFDDEGSKFDGDGNLKGWWTKKDRADFEKRTKILEKQFNEYSVAPGINVNGKLTLGENIADLGGMVISYYAYKKHLEKTDTRKNIDGFTPEQRFFLGAALFERENSRQEFLNMVVKTDPHSPSKFRVNGPTSNLNEFYEAYKVKKGDKLYRIPSNRAQIW